MPRAALLLGGVFLVAAAAPSWHAASDKRWVRYWNKQAKQHYWYDVDTHGISWTKPADVDALSDEKVAEKVVRCEVSHWTSWVACSKTCGDGVRVKTRSVIVHGTASHSLGGCPALSKSKPCHESDCTGGMAGLTQSELGHHGSGMGNAGEPGLHPVVMGAKPTKKPCTQALDFLGMIGENSDCDQPKHKYDIKHEALHTFPPTSVPTPVPTPQTREPTSAPTRRSPAPTPKGTLPPTATAQPTVAPTSVPTPVPPTPFPTPAPTPPTAAPTPVPTPYREDIAPTKQVTVYLSLAGPHLSLTPAVRKALVAGIAAGAGVRQEHVKVRLIDATLVDSQTTKLIVRTRVGCRDRDEAVGVSLAIGGQNGPAFLREIESGLHLGPGSAAIKHNDDDSAGSIEIGDATGVFAGLVVTGQLKLRTKTDFSPTKVEGLGPAGEQRASKMSGGETGQVVISRKEVKRVEDYVRFSVLASMLGALAACARYWCRDQESAFEQDRQGKKGRPGHLQTYNSTWESDDFTFEEEVLSPSYSESPRPMVRGAPTTTSRTRKRSTGRLSSLI
jgi:hypothetical protein